MNLHYLDNITLVFPPLLNQEQGLKETINLKHEEVVFFDCRTILYLSEKYFFELLLLAMGGKNTAKTIHLTYCLNTIQNQINSHQKNVTIVIKNIQYIMPIIEPILLHLMIVKENCPRLNRFVFTTNINLYSERIYQRLKAMPFILDNIKYFAYTDVNFTLRETEIIWYQLSSISRRLIRLILVGEKEFSFNLLSDVEYLLKTGIVSQINQQYICNFKYLNQILSKRHHHLLTLKNNHIFLGEENINHRFTSKQLQVLRLLLKNKNKIVDRDMIADILWIDEEQYSDWAIDKFIQRLRKVMENNFVDGKSLKAVKKKGFILEIKEKTTISQPKIYSKGLQFIELTNDREVFEFHKKSFQSPRLRKILYKTTPHTDKEIIDWLKDVSNRDDHSYFSIYLNGKIIGHIGLDRKEKESSSARIGCFLADPDKWGIYGKQIFSYIIKQADNEGLQFVYIDIASTEPTQIRQLENLGFHKSPHRDHVLFLNIFSTSRSLI